VKDDTTAAARKKAMEAVRAVMEAAKEVMKVKDDTTAAIRRKAMEAVRAVMEVAREVMKVKDDTTAAVRKKATGVPKEVMEAVSKEALVADGMIMALAVNRENTAEVDHKTIMAPAHNRVHSGEGTFLMAAGEFT
jgi:transcriptional regulator of nitric oxide reductase